MQERRCVIVAGLPRSGTSWLAKSLSFARDFTYYREPDNVDMVAEAEDRFRTLYLTGDHDDPAYRRLMTRALTGRLATRFTMREDPGPLITALGGGRGLRVAQRFPFLYFRKRHVLVKLVNSNLNLAWFTANFPHARQLFVVRHPCGQFESWRRLGWEPDPRALLENRRLVEDHLAPFADLIARADGFWERAGALWAATVHVVHRQTRAQDGRLDRRLRMALRRSAEPLPGPVPTARHDVDRRCRAVHPCGGHRGRPRHLLDAPAYREADRQVEGATEAGGHRRVPPLRGAVRPSLLSRLRAPRRELRGGSAGMTA